MLLNRNRGLTNLHNAVTVLAVGLFYWVYAMALREWFSDTVRVTDDSPLMPYFVTVVLGLLLGWPRVTAVSGRLTKLSGVEAAGLATQQVTILALVVFSFMFASQDRSISRLFLGSFLALTWLLLALVHRRLPHRLAESFFGRGQRVPTLFAGRTAQLPSWERWVERHAHLGVLPVGYVSFAPLAGSEPPVAGWAGSLADLPRLIDELGVGQVILLELPARDEEAKAVIEACQARGCRLLVHHNVEERLGHPVMATTEDGQSFFTLHAEPLEEPINRAVKRAFDLVVALPVVVGVLPGLCAVVWLVQRIQSPGPLFHVRQRAGVQRAPFAMLKFRTMHVAPPDEQAESRQATAQDPRVYPLGRWLRRHSLDEFPQFWNVLIGDMSLVGPRPVMPLLDEEFERQARAYRTRHLVRPGITGLAQSEGFRGEITTPEQLQARVRLDLYYIAHWSIWLDLQITAKTFGQVFFPPKSAY